MYVMDFDLDDDVFIMWIMVLFVVEELKKLYKK